MWGIHILGIQGALPIEQLFLNAQIGHAISKSLHMVIAGQTPYYHSSNASIAIKTELLNHIVVFKVP
jgi:hypothetical protein